MKAHRGEDFGGAASIGADPLASAVFTIEEVVKGVAT
jgi:hypothetical protein